MRKYSVLKKYIYPLVIRFDEFVYRFLVSYHVTPYFYPTRASNRIDVASGRWSGGVGMVSLLLSLE